MHVFICFNSVVCKISPQLCGVLFKQHFLVVFFDMLYKVVRHPRRPGPGVVCRVGKNGGDSFQEQTKEPLECYMLVSDWA